MVLKNYFIQRIVLHGIACDLTLPHRYGLRFNWKGEIKFYTTGQLERETGIIERTIAYYNSLGLLTLKKKQGKMRH